MLDVPGVELKLLVPAEVVAAVDLRPAGDAGAHGVAQLLARGIIRQITGQEGARSDECHVTDEDVYELWEFVNRSGAHEATRTGEALAVGEEVALGVAAVVHGLELEKTEDAPALAGTLLGEKDSGSMIGEVKPCGDD